MQLKNWGLVRDESTKALYFNANNVKACYRLAKGHQNLKNWEEANDAIEKGLSIPNESDNQDLIKLQTLLTERVRRARVARQKRERARAERIVKVKKVWKWCQESGYRLGRVPLVNTVVDDEDEIGGEEEFRWHFHQPHTGRLPIDFGGNKEWVWPCMFVYPSHGQSDFIERFAESEMFASRMAEAFPEIENDGDGGGETSMPWDHNNEFVCSKLAVYFEVHYEVETDDENMIIHPENVSPLKTQAATMKFYEASRALKGDEGPEIAEVARCLERKLLHKQRKRWNKKHGSLWSKPDPCAVVRVHPAAMLRDVLTDSRMVVPNFLPTFLIFPENHVAHEEFCRDHKCVGIIEPQNS
mmetsp:Transcript_31024/g.31293  ORF Transcript_31024/g.31293 Transcript_31024/m.31293 type:complete len:356 (-) Transcript_31024:355-1422(-)